MRGRHSLGPGFDFAVCCIMMRKVEIVTKEEVFLPKKCRRSQLGQPEQIQG